MQQALSLDSALWIASVVGEIALLSILLLRKAYRTFPVFVAWISLSVLLEPVYYWLVLHLSHDTYLKVFFALSFPQYLVELGVLVDIAVNVLRPVNKALPKAILYFLAIGTVIIGIVAFFFTAHLNAATLAHPRSFIVMSTTMAILRLVTFLLIAALSQLLGLGWKNHVLQLASGLAFYAAVTLIVELGHSKLRAGPDYVHQFTALDHFRVLGYLCSLTYWCFSFVRKEAPRKEFSPQMAQLLVSISGSAKRQHSVVARSVDIK
jgi:hypothetical protein